MPSIQLGGQHALGGARPVDLGHPEALVGLDRVAHLRDRRGLESEIHLELGRARQVLDHGHGLQAPRRRVEALDQARGEEVAVEIALEAPLDPGSQDLDRHLAAARRSRP